MALSTFRNTVQVASSRTGTTRKVGQATSTTLYVGALVATNASGFLVAGSTATTLKAVGVLGVQPHLRPASSYTNSGANGAQELQVQLGVFKFNNDAGDPLAVANTGGPCYITDDETVSVTATGKSLAGTFLGLDDDGQAIVDVGVHPLGLGV
jgi:hypothetical protein